MMIVLENLSYSYRKGSEALDGVSASIGEGVYLLLGENGAGKTTLLKVMCGLLRPTCGSCVVDGRPVEFHEPLTMEKIFYLGDGMMFPAATVNVMARVHGCFYPSFDHESLREALALFGMTGDEDLAKMSLGNRHKAQLAYALSLHTDILLLDEPTNGLDITSKQTLGRLLAGWASDGRTLIVSTHTVSDLQSLYDSIIVLSHGKLLLASRTGDVTDRVAFTVSMSAPADPLYCEQRYGLFRAIEPNYGDSDTEIDYTLLYNALSSPFSSRVLECINKKMDININEDGNTDE